MPVAVEVDYQTALKRHCAGDLDGAEELYRMALLTLPDHAPTLHALGVIAYQRGRWDAARGWLDRAIALVPDHAEALLALGAVAMAMGQPEEAVAHYDSALATAPDCAEALGNRGNALRALGRIAEAEASYRRAVALRPGLAAAHKNLGACLLDLGRPAEAVAALAEATRRNARSAEAHGLLGKALSLCGRFEESIAPLRDAVRLDPASWLPHHDLATALKRGGWPVEALKSFDEAIRLRPDAADSLVNRATVLLQLGDFDRGWPEYEWRRRHPALAPRQFVGPDWHGGPIVGRTVLIVAEQGLGDTLHFVRFAPLVRERGARVIVAAPARLHAVLATCPGIDELTDIDGPVPQFDVQVPLMSLPLLLGTTPGTIPAGVPYLAAEAARVECCRARLAGLGPGLRVGVCWKGNPDHPGDNERSFPLAELEPLARVPGVHLVSLQVPDAVTRAEIATVPFTVNTLDADPDAGAFVDTAALMMNLDLVVTADTAPAHLAGALGVPVWIALGRIADWRWQLGRDDSPWYPSARLFRRERSRGWDAVFQSIADALAGWAERRGRLGLVPVEIAPGELLDKITILEIKSERIADAGRLEPVGRELAALRSARDRFIPDWPRARHLIDALRRTNAALWDVENLIRAAERDTTFGREYLEHTRSVARHNDARYALKRRLNEVFQAAYGEQKDYLGAAVGRALSRV